LWFLARLAKGILRSKDSASLWEINALAPCQPTARLAVENMAMYKAVESLTYSL